MSKVIAIFGAGSGLGMSLARRFGREGYRVALISRDSTKLASLVSELRAADIDAAAFVADLLDTHRVQALVSKVRDHFNRIDVVVYEPSAASVGFVPATALTGERLQESVALFLLSLIEVVREVLPAMLDQGDGAIVATHGIAAAIPMPHLSGPSTATAASRNYLHALRAELEGTGVYTGTFVVGGYISRGQIRQVANVTAAGDLDSERCTEIPTFDPDDLADSYWDLIRRRHRAELIVSASK